MIHDEECCEFLSDSCGANRANTLGHAANVLRHVTMPQLPDSLARLDSLAFGSSPNPPNSAVAARAQIVHARREREREKELSERKGHRSRENVHFGVAERKAKEKRAWRCWK